MYLSQPNDRDDVGVADINPIGSISKTDLKRFIAYARDAFDLPILGRCADPSIAFDARTFWLSNIKLPGRCANCRT
jgi:hypothetical protein